MIEVRGLSGTWGTFSLRKVCVNVDQGEYLVVLGPCGAGKTLLLETIAGLHASTSGSVLINGVDVTRVPPEKRGVGFVYQQQCLFPHLSVMENIGYGLRYRGFTKDEQQRRIGEMVELLDLHDIAGRRNPSSLSGGEIQQVAIARALAVKPAVLLLDEPMASLDSTTRGKVHDILRQVSDRTQVPVIHVTHDQNEAASLAGRIALINEGAIVQTGTAEDVFWRPRSRFAAAFLGVENMIEGVASPVGNGLAHISVGPLVMTAAYDGPASPITICLRPEDLVVSAQKTTNTYAAVLREASEDGFEIRMTLEINGGPQLIARMARMAFREMAPVVGSEVFIQIPLSAIHVVGPEEAGEPNHAD